MKTKTFYASAELIPAIEVLVNKAYRGEVSKKGWTTEADLLLGELRTDAVVLSTLINKKDAVIVVCAQEDNDTLVGCVYLEKQGHQLYLGMLSVLPELQGAGIGKKLLAAADAHAASVQCSLIYMSVFSVRTELVNWYKRHGYDDTGKTKPFIADERFGIPTQPLEFMILEKKITRLS